ncbi:exported avidin family domain protein [Burkholderia thailandensis USAMRU Malaysia |nr:exported avidin family domain protein [Burkholderia thailandensis 2002721723]AHI81472.1 exported avidin family domain protein [Burkholderia thailandensis E444]AIC89612.1 exported avidin family domain protein [Burkholderia thailandensis USAMRU Malaysia \
MQFLERTNHHPEHRGKPFLFPAGSTRPHRHPPGWTRSRFSHFPSTGTPLRRNTTASPRGRELAGRQTAHRRSKRSGTTPTHSANIPGSTPTLAKTFSSQPARNRNAISRARRTLPSGSAGFATLGRNAADVAWHDLGSAMLRNERIDTGRGNWRLTVRPNEACGRLTASCNSFWQYLLSPGSRRASTRPPRTRCHATLARSTRCRTASFAARRQPDASDQHRLGACVRHEPATLRSSRSLGHFPGCFVDIVAGSSPNISLNCAVFHGRLLIPFPKTIKPQILNIIY